MSRRKNQVATKDLSVSVTPRILEYLADLVDTGLYGRSQPNAAERLIERGIESALKDGTIVRRTLIGPPA